MPSSKHLQTNQVLPTASRTHLGINSVMKLTKTWKLPLCSTAPMAGHKSQLHLT